MEDNDFFIENYTHNIKKDKKTFNEKNIIFHIFLNHNNVLMIRINVPLVKSIIVLKYLIKKGQAKRLKLKSNDKFGCM